MPNRLDIDALRALQAIATHGGVTRAAAKLALSQPAVSHKIRRLETQLGADLLTRRAGGPLLSETGTRLLGYAERILALHDEALAALSTTALSGTIRLGLTEDTTGGDLARLLGRFARAHPDTRLQARVSQSLTLADWLDRGEIDLAVMQVFARDQRPGDLVLGEDRLHWIKSPDLRLAAGAPVPFLAYDAGCFYRRWAETAALDAGRRLEVVLDCPSTAGLLAAVQAGLGVTVMNARHLRADHEIVAGLLPDPPPIVYVARTGPTRRPPALRALLAAVAEALGGAVPLRVA